MERAGKKLKEKYCGKKPEIGDFSSINAEKTKIMLE
jgi:hypothetical protein